MDDNETRKFLLGRGRVQNNTASKEANCGLKAMNKPGPDECHTRTNCSTEQEERKYD